MRVLGPIKSYDLITAAGGLVDSFRYRPAQADPAPHAGPQHVAIGIRDLKCGDFPGCDSYQFGRYVWHQLGVDRDTRALLEEAYYVQQWMSES